MNQIGFISLALAAICHSLACGQQASESFIKVEVQGKLRDGLVAIGGETTGIQITASGITWELDLGEDEKRLQFAKEFDRKMVVVSGTLEHRKGVEVPDRWICHVCNIKAAEEDKEDQFIKVQFKGMLRDGVVAIGGETTGTTITAGDITWEIDLSKNEELRQTATALHKKTALVSGTLKVQKGIEVPNRFLITPTTLKTAK